MFLHCYDSILGLFALKIFQFAISFSAQSCAVWFKTVSDTIELIGALQPMATMKNIQHTSLVQNMFSSRLKYLIRQFGVF